MNPYLRLYRPVNNIMAALAVVSAAFIGAGAGIIVFWEQVLLAALVVFFFTGGSNALNDYFDRDIDRINHPERPLPSGKISPERALYIGSISMLIPVLLGLFMSPESLIIIVIAEILMLSYEISLKNKGLVGNIDISVLVGMLFLFGGACVGSIDRTLIFSAMASLATFGREIVKDIEDVEGDIGRATLPKMIGKERSAFVAAIAFMAAVSLSPLPYGRDFGFMYIVIVSAADILFFYTSYLSLTDPKKSQKMAKVSMLVGLLAFLAGRLQFL